MRRQTMMCVVVLLLLVSPADAFIGGLFSKLKDVFTDAIDVLTDTFDDVVGVAVKGVKFVVKGVTVVAETTKLDGFIDALDGPVGKVVGTLGDVAGEAREALGAFGLLECIVGGCTPPQVCIPGKGCKDPCWIASHVPGLGFDECGEGKVCVPGGGCLDICSRASRAAGLSCNAGTGCNLGKCFATFAIEPILKCLFSECERGVIRQLEQCTPSTCHLSVGCIHIDHKMKVERNDRMQGVAYKAYVGVEANPTLELKLDSTQKSFKLEFPAGSQVTLFGEVTAKLQKEIQILDQEHTLFETEEKTVYSKVYMAGNIPVRISVTIKGKGIMEHAVTLTEDAAVSMVMDCSVPFNGFIRGDATKPHQAAASFHLGGISSDCFKFVISSKEGATATLELGFGVIVAVKVNEIPLEVFPKLRFVAEAQLTHQSSQPGCINRQVITKAGPELTAHFIPSLPGVGVVANAICIDFRNLAASCLQGIAEPLADLVTMFPCLPDFEIIEISGVTGPTLKFGPFNKYLSRHNDQWCPGGGTGCCTESSGDLRAEAQRELHVSGSGLTVGPVGTSSLEGKYFTAAAAVGEATNRYTDFIYRIPGPSRDWTSAKTFVARFRAATPLGDTGRSGLMIFAHNTVGKNNQGTGYHLLGRFRFYRERTEVHIGLDHMPNKGSVDHIIFRVRRRDFTTSQRTYLTSWKVTAADVDRPFASGVLGIVGTIATRLSGKTRYLVGRQFRTAAFEPQSSLDLTLELPSVFTDTTTASGRPNGVFAITEGLIDGDATVSIVSEYGGSGGLYYLTNSNGVAKMETYRNSPGWKKAATFVVGSSGAFGDRGAANLPVTIRPLNDMTRVLGTGSTFVVPAAATSATKWNISGAAGAKIVADFEDPSCLSDGGLTTSDRRHKGPFWHPYYSWADNIIYWDVYSGPGVGGYVDLRWWVPPSVRDWSEFEYLCVKYRAWTEPAAANQGIGIFVYRADLGYMHVGYAEHISPDLQTLRISILDTRDSLKHVSFILFRVYPEVFDPTLANAAARQRTHLFAIWLERPRSSANERVGPIERYTTACANARGQDVKALDSMFAPHVADRAYTGWWLVKDHCHGDWRRIIYSYVRLPTGALGAPSTRQTDCHPLGDEDIIYLDRHNVACGTDEVLVAIDVTRCNYNYKCARVSHHYSLQHAFSGKTDCNPARESVEYLDRHRIDCPEGSMLQRFQMVGTGCHGYNRRYEFSCVKLV